jgi:hypothetical protein
MKRKDYQSFMSRKEKPPIWIIFRANEEKMKLARASRQIKCSILSQPFVIQDGVSDIWMAIDLEKTKIGYVKLSYYNWTSDNGVK